MSSVVSSREGDSDGSVSEMDGSKDGRMDGAMAREEGQGGLLSVSQSRESVARRRQPVRLARHRHTARGTGGRFAKVPKQRSLRAARVDRRSPRPNEQQQQQQPPQVGGGAPDGDTVRVLLYLNEQRQAAHKISCE